MIFYIIKRLLLAALTLLAILLASYVLLRLAPGDPTRSTMIGGETSSSGGASQDASRAAFAPNRSMREKLHLDRPVLVGFSLWLAQVAHGDFGVSASVDPGRPVTDLIKDRLPITIGLNLWAIFLTYLLAIPLGVRSATKPDAWEDRLTTILLFALYSLPVIWVGLMLQSQFCEGGRWPIFPLKGTGSADPLRTDTWEYLSGMFKAYFIPVVCLTYAGFAGLSRYARNSMLEVLHEDFIRTARAKGVSETKVIWKHALRNALITLITLFAGLLPSLIAGSLLVEFIFNIPGMGTLSMLALSSRDYPLQMALFAFAGALTLGGILLADLLYLAADPRISLTKKRP